MSHYRDTILATIGVVLLICWMFPTEAARQVAKGVKAYQIEMSQP